jgi:hypothetical protein
MNAGKRATKARTPRSFADLVNKTNRAVFNYNNVKSHKSLKKKTHATFELCMPVGGYSLPTDNYCSFSNSIKQQHKNYQLSKSTKSRTKGVEKKLNKVKVSSLSNFNYNFSNSMLFQHFLHSRRYLL